MIGSKRTLAGPMAMCFCMAGLAGAPLSASAEPAGPEAIAPTPGGTIRALEFGKAVKDPRKCKGDAVLPPFTVEFKEAVKGWMIGVEPALIGLRVTTEAGEPLGEPRFNGCFGSYTTVLDFPAGRYRVEPYIGYEDRGYDVAFQGGVKRQIVVRPVSADPFLSLAVAPAGDVPLAERSIQAWVPALQLKQLESDLALRTEVLRKAPRALFVYSKRDMPARKGYGGNSEDDDVAPEIPGVKTGEPLLRLGWNTLTYLALDGTIYAIDGGLKTVMPVSKGVVQAGTLDAAPPAGGPVLPTSVRSSWAPLQRLLDGAEGPEEQKLASAYRKKAAEARGCEDNAVLRYSRVADNINSTAKQVAAASRKLEADRNRCGIAKVRALRETTRAALQKARDARMQKNLDELRAAWGG
ncbi:MAG TPA: hypothetical protein PK668_26945 [Myxococcota bacterium]|nr:hypothetical protein [Myxococcota bacterium]HRY97166.1 hypothetical protein [Myxococcota bacterium]HSA20707.1 hypothetical protein [Myxococcota bacterium]